jgi:hypothetical protein
MPRRCCSERAKKSEAAGEDGRLVTKQTQRLDQALGAFGERNGIKQTVNALSGKSFEKGDAAGETLIEIPALRAWRLR